MRVVLSGIFILLTLGAQAQNFPEEVLRDFRMTHELSVPGWNPALADSCQSRARDLAESGTLEHRDPLGRSPGVQMLAQGFSPGTVGEILGAGSDPAAVWKAWLASPGHRKILETPGWVSWGAGQARVGATMVYVVRFWAP